MSKETEVKDKEWYVWTVRAGKFEVVKRYMEEHIPQITKVLYPTITTEKTTRNGSLKKQRSPLYAGYIFLQYEHDVTNPGTWLKINKHPFITGYVGPCTPKDLVSVDSLQKVDTLNNDKVRKFMLGDSVRVNGGLFINYKGRVTSLTSNSIGVELINENKVFKAVLSPEDLDIVDR